MVDANPLVRRQHWRSSHDDEILISLGLPVCACVCVQKLKGRLRCLKQIGGAAQLIIRAQSRGAAWAQGAGPELEKQIDFLVSLDASEFHSDENDEEEEQAGHSVRVTLQHTFRSQMAGDIVHALDEGRVPVRESTRPGCELSAAKAARLLQPHYAAYAQLFQADIIHAIAALKKRKPADEVEESVQENQTVSTRSAQ